MVTSLQELYAVILSDFFSSTSYKRSISFVFSERERRKKEREQEREKQWERKTNINYSHLSSFNILLFDALSYHSRDVMPLMCDNKINFRRKIWKIMVHLLCLRKYSAAFARFCMCAHSWHHHSIYCTFNRKKRTLIDLFWINSFSCIWLEPQRRRRRQQWQWANIEAHSIKMENNKINFEIFFVWYCDCVQQNALKSMVREYSLPIWLIDGFFCSLCVYKSTIAFEMFANFYDNATDVRVCLHIHIQSISARMHISVCECDEWASNVR